MLLGVYFTAAVAQKPAKKESAAAPVNYTKAFQAMKWRNIGPHRGGRSVAASGVVQNPLVYYAGYTGGGVWKTEDAGVSWKNISDGHFKTSSVGAISVSESDPLTVYVGMGEHAVRGVMTSYGDGVYKSTDGGQSWAHLGLEKTRHIAAVRIHPQNPEIVYVAAQGALHGKSSERGVYKSTDGGKTWKKTLYVDENTGCADLSMDMNNPRILYAAMWEYMRYPWQVKSGGKGSGLYKSTDGGETWTKLDKGLPKAMGKMGISVSRANSSKVYAVIESDSRTDKGGVYVSGDGGKSWTQTTKNRYTVQRAWYYTEIFADTQNENVVYVLNVPMLKSIDGGKTFSPVSVAHGDTHHLWIHPANSKNIILADDGGATISFNGGQTWSIQYNQPTAQFYRVNADNRFPYRVYGGQQDNTSVMIESRNTYGGGITEKNWTASAGGESAFIAFNPNNPRYVFGGSYQGTIAVLDQYAQDEKPVMEYPMQYQAQKPRDMKYRFNWNAPILASMHDTTTYYHGGNRLFHTTNLGQSWEPVSPDLTRNDTAKQGLGGFPYTNEGAGGENYNTLMYIAESRHEKDVLWVGSDDGLVHLTRDGGKTWTNVTPKELGETIINCIEVSPHDKATVYIATTRYKFNDFAPAIYRTKDYGKTWTKIVTGIGPDAYTRAVREDPVRKGLLYAGTETGFYISYNDGANWTNLNLNLPVTPITDLKVHQNDLIAATAGRSFWILDDITPFQQFNEKILTDSLFVYKPKDTYRVTGQSPMDKVYGEDEEEGDESGEYLPAGTNPANGVVIQYYLPSRLDTATAVSLEILDDKGTLIRKFVTKKDPKFVEFPGGPPRDPVVQTKAGMNRFVWDMRSETLPAVDRIFIEGSYRGRKVAPGVYQARLKVRDKEQTVSFTILPDPRIKATSAEYAKQQQLLIATENGVKEIHTAVNQMRKAQSQVNSLISLVEGMPEYKIVIDSGKALVKRIQDWQELLVQTRAQSNDDVINFDNKLSASFIFLKGEADANRPQVTAGQEFRLKEMQDEWAKYKTTMDKLINQDVAAFNQLCRKLNIEKVTIPKSKPSTP